MNKESEQQYNHIRSGGAGYYEQKRGLIAVWGKEAVQFLDGLISNDMKMLEDGGQMLAAFPNAQGRLLAVVRVLRQGDRFLFETEEATREKLFQNLFRFTFAGDFFVEDLSESFRFFDLFGKPRVAEAPCVVNFSGRSGPTWAIPKDEVLGFFRQITDTEAVEIDDDLYEILRIEYGIPRYGVDMDETTIVPELGMDGLISYHKGCYIGQEIIARIHFRGHVAKQLTGLVLSEPPAAVGGSTSDMELTSADGKNAGRITSVTFSPTLRKTIGLAYVRYDYLAEGTDLNGIGFTGVVKNLPFIS